MTTEKDLDAPPMPPAPPLTTTTSIKPAASILILAAVMLVVFMLINGIADAGDTTATTVAVVGGLSVDTSHAVLNGCITPGAPPGNIIGGYIVPVATSSDGPYNVQTSDAGAYDCSRQLAAPYGQGEILGFYINQLRAQGWAVFSEAPAAHTGMEQVLFDKAGSDTFYWVAGVTIDTHSAHRTSWTLRFYQNDALD